MLVDMAVDIVKTNRFGIGDIWEQINKQTNKLRCLSGTDEFNQFIRKIQKIYKTYAKDEDLCNVINFLYSDT